MQYNYSKSVDPHTMALRSIGWIVAEPGRAERFFTLTGLDSDLLRAGLADPAVQAAALDFLMAHEPDLLSCADAIEESPAAIAAARAAIG